MNKIRLRYSFGVDALTFEYVTATIHYCTVLVLYHFCSHGRVIIQVIVHPSINHIVGCQSGDLKRDATKAEIGLGLLNSCTYYLRSLQQSAVWPRVRPFAFLVSILP